jgi:peptidyl-prolyl cis-trans isomerase SurA
MLRRTVTSLAFAAAMILPAFPVTSSLPDSVAMLVNGKPILLADFLFIAQKNGEADLSSLSALHDYVLLYKNFRLKVAEAESQGIDTTEAFHKELAEYRRQLELSYLADKPAEDKVLRNAYALGNELLEFSYLLFRFPAERTLRKDTAEAFQHASLIHARLRNGENIDSLGAELTKDGIHKVIYEYVPSLPPFRALKALDDAIFSLPAGALSAPIRTGHGYYLVQMHRRHLHPGRLHVAHILAGLAIDTLTRSPQEARAQAEELYARLLDGEDFSQLAKQYSTDALSAPNGGVLLPPFGPNEMIPDFEKAAFALSQPGQLSPIIQSRFGFHIIRLIEKLPRASFETERPSLENRLTRTEHQFELHKAFDQRLKKEYNYTPYPDAYAQLENRCDLFFPAQKEFADFNLPDSLLITPPPPSPSDTLPPVIPAKAGISPGITQPPLNSTNISPSNTPLFSVAGITISLQDFANFLVSQPLSTKTYAPEYLHEAYHIFLHELLTNIERQNLALKHPEYAFLLQEYRDGILLFEVSNREIWTKPVKLQEKLEKKWLKKLNAKFPVIINWDLINRQLRPSTPSTTTPSPSTPTP